MLYVLIYETRPTVMETRRIGHRTIVGLPAPVRRHLMKVVGRRD